METIYLINANFEDKQEVVTKLLENPGIVDAYPVFGVYDVVAITNAEDPLIFEKMLKIEIPEIILLTALVSDVKENENLFTFHTHIFNEVGV